MTARVITGEEEGSSMNRRYSIWVRVFVLASGIAHAGCTSEQTDVEAEGDEAPGVEVGKRRNALYPQTSTLTFRPGPEGKDAVVFSHPDHVDKNKGDVKQLDALAWTYSGVPGIYRSYIQFDLSSISPGAIVTSAALRLTANTTASVNLVGHSTLSGPNDGWLARVTGPWSESTITWNDQPPVNLVNAVAVPASASSNQAYTIDVTGMVKDMVENPASNNGFMLQLATEQHYRALRFWSGDADDASQRPALDVIVQGCLH